MVDLDRDAIDDFLDDILGPDTAYEDIGIVSLFEGDPEALEAIEETIPKVNGRRVRSE